MLRRSLEPSEFERFRNCPSKPLRFVMDSLRFSSFHLSICSSVALSSRHPTFTSTP
jgi:hypothetical protein